MRQVVGALPLEQRVRLDTALEEAFAPLRASGTSLSPARVRAAIRWTPAAPPPLRGAALFGRAGELATAAAAFVFAASLAPVALPGAGGASASSTLPADGVRVAPGLALDRPEIFARWLRVGRSVAANDLLDPLVGVAGVAAALNDPPADTVYRVRQGLLR